VKTMLREPTPLLLVLLVAQVAGHGMLVSPPSRNAADRFLAEFQNGQSPQTPCTCPNAGHRDQRGDHGSLPCDEGLRALAGGQPCLWWSQGCTIGCDKCTGDTQTQTGGKRLCNGTLEPTLPREAYTMNMDIHASEVDVYRYHPWRAPGHAPVDDACGRAGGTVWEYAGGGADAVFTNTSMAHMGDLGSDALPYSPSGTVWSAGTSVEVGWGITYNHGGGYQYRLCPKNEPLTEACFQKLPLEFDRSRQALLWNNGARYPLKGIFVDKGTMPEGSTWARNPVPRAGEANAGCLRPNASEPHGNCLSFAPPCPQDCSGEPDCQNPGGGNDPGTWQGPCSGDWKGGQIIDSVIIPAEVPAGEYVLGWRWDCEETTQIWASCADVTISATVNLSSNSVHFP